MVQGHYTLCTRKERLRGKLTSHLTMERHTAP
uniref:Uncharacterized protein n=1 Tax=Arundo donax TaxID=35708 RepID=A0A0A9DXD4_ARUDO